MRLNQDYNNICLFLKEIAQYVSYLHVVGVVGRRFYKQFKETLCTTLQKILKHIILFD